MGAFKLNTVQTDKFVNNVVTFLIPLGILYFGQLSGTLGLEGNVIELTDFIPNSVTLGGAAYYIMSVLIDYKKKLDTTNK